MDTWLSVEFLLESIVCACPCTHYQNLQMHKRFHSSLLKALLEKTTEKEIKFLVIIKRMRAHTHLLTWNTFIFYSFTNLQKISELKIGKRQSSHATSFAVSPEVGLNESPLSSC